MKEHVRSSFPYVVLLCLLAMAIALVLAWLGFVIKPAPYAGQWHVFLKHRASAQMDMELPFYRLLCILVMLLGLGARWYLDDDKDSERRRELCLAWSFVLSLFIFGQLVLLLILFLKGGASSGMLVWGIMAAVSVLSIFFISDLNKMVSKIINFIKQRDDKNTLLCLMGGVAMLGAWLTPHMLSSILVFVILGLAYRLFHWPLWHYPFLMGVLALALVLNRQTFDLNFIGFCFLLLGWAWGRKHGYSPFLVATLDSDAKAVKIQALMGGVLLAMALILFPWGKHIATESLTAVLRGRHFLLFNLSLIWPITFLFFLLRAISMYLSLNQQGDLNKQDRRESLLFPLSLIGLLVYWLWLIFGLDSTLWAYLLCLWIIAIASFIEEEKMIFWPWIYAWLSLMIFMSLFLLKFVH